MNTKKGIEDSKIENAGHDISFMDLPGILQFAFYPRKTKPVSESSHKAALSFLVDGIRLEGVLHLAGTSAPNILLFHGNGETASDYDDLGPIFASLGINFSIIDYRGYGISGGEPKYSTMISDARAIFPEYVNFLAERSLTGPVFIMGRSIGSAPALELAALHQNEIAGLIIESGFSHTYRLMVNLGADAALLDPSRESLVSNLEKVRRVKSPMLVIHGEMDEIIPLSDGVDLYNGAPSEAKEMLVIPGAGHNTLMLYGLEEYLNAVASFVSRSTKG